MFLGSYADDGRPVTGVINLNADVGESWGAHTVGNDAELIPLVDSVNIACGAHGGDHRTMRRCVEIAVEHGIEVGAHPGFFDLEGFGRRRLDLSPSEIESLIAVQIGALQAVAALEGVTLTHVKPHGALYNMAAEHRRIADPIARAVASVDRSLILVGQANTPMIDAGEDHGLRVAREGFADRSYTAAGLLVARSQPDAVIHDPEVAAARVVAMAVTGTVAAVDDVPVAVPVETVCLHGDGPTATAIARAVGAALRAAGIGRRPLAATGP